VTSTGPGLAIVLAAALSSPLVGQRILPPGALREATLSFDARATLGAFTGTTTTAIGEMTGGPLDMVRGWVEAPVASLRTGNGLRDKDLNKSMESAAHPTMRFDLDSLEVADESADSAAATLYGRLTLRGVTRPVGLPARLWFQADTVRLRTEFPVNVKDYGVRGLSKVLGMFKMHPDIVVHADLTFVSGAAAAEPPAADPVARPPAPE
jgi:polyisoprenoid-binding protein YceI